MDFHTAFLVLFYGFSFILKIYEVHKQREQEKKLAKTLDKLDKLFDNSKKIDK